MDVEACEVVTALAGAPKASRTPQDVERGVLATLVQFLAELGTGAGPPRLDDALDRDLGLGSLERVELLFRLEQAFGLRFPDGLLAEAATPRDLVRAILAGTAQGAEAVREPVALVDLGRPGAPLGARTLTEALARHAEATPDRIHIVLEGEDGSEQLITYGALWRQATAVGAALGERIRPRDAVAIMLRTEAAFFPTFFGVLLAGGVPVPIYPPFRLDRLEEYARRQVGILRNADARLLITFREAERVAHLLRRRVPSLDASLTVEPLVAGSPPRWMPPPSSADVSALIQYTSGSTGDPKGVVLTHANVLANIRALGEALAVRPDDVGVSWLPLYHDMGLIGMWLGSLYHAVPVVILSPLTFLARPVRWLRALHRYRGTISAAPNFAFDLCTRRIHDEELTGLDLSAWRVAANASEPVSADSIERFTRRFSPCGFRPEAMFPVYGLAESTVGLTMPPLGRPPRIERVVRDTFERFRRAEPAPSDDRSPLRFVSCGRPLPGHEVRIVDGADRPLPERVEGHVQFRGPSVMAGYHRNPAATRKAFHDGWLDSGDLGYFSQGELFVTGRSKDVIIKAGRNLYPHEVEEIVGELPGIRKGCVAAFGVTDPAIGTERLVVVAETRERSRDAHDRLRAAVIDGMVAALGLPPDVVVLAPPGTVLKTPSGKIRRSATREAYLSGTLTRPRPPVLLQWMRLGLTDLALAAGRLAAGAGRVVFGLWVGLLLALTVPPLWALVHLLPAGRQVDRVVRRWARAFLTLGGCRLRVEGLERVPPAPVVFVANHASYVDAVVFVATLPEGVRLVAKRELLARPLIGTVIRKSGHPTVERFDPARSAADAARVADVLRAGVSLLFFPEGTFDRAPGLLPFRLGAFKTALETGCPVVPVAIRGTRHILPAHAWLPRPGAVTVVIGAPIVPQGGDWREITRIRDAARSWIAAAVEEPEAAPRIFLANARHERA